MAKTDRYREQHAEVEKLISQISAQMDSTRLTTDATQVRALLSTTAGKLKLHLKLEDECLYPALSKHSDPAVRKLADRYQKDMGGLAAGLESFLNRWPGAAAIQQNAPGFIRETKQILSALTARIERENKELYRVVDAAA